MQFFKNQPGLELYKFFRLLLPALDRERGYYGLKESSLSKLYAEVLALPQKQRDSLKHYKNPMKQEEGAPTGDFIGVLLHIMRYRKRDESAGYTVEKINTEMLDKIATSYELSEKVAVMSSMLPGMNLLELKWLTRIILKDMKLGIGHETILKMYHKHAMDIFNSTSDLKAVFSQVEEFEEVTGGDGSGQVVYRMFFPVKPMLAGKVANLGQLAEIVRTKESGMIVETKFDGERIQCHYQDGMVKFFSRNGKDYTRIYGTALSDYIRDNVIAQAALLDGEVIVWDKENNKIAPFGKNKPVALQDESAIDADHKYQLCYMIFDCLFYKPRPSEGNLNTEEYQLMQCPLIERKKVLQKIVREIPHKLEITKSFNCSSTQQVIDKFQEAIDAQEEGIMIKDTMSMYHPNNRSAGYWIKLKADYIDQLGDTLDLIVLGGYFGEKSRTVSQTGMSSHVTKFLLGILSRVDEKVPSRSQAIPFVRVGTGYSMEELTGLRNKLANNFEQFDPRYAKIMGKPWKPDMSTKPDVIIKDLSKSVILEVKAAEL